MVAIRFIIDTQQATSSPFIGDKTLKYIMVPIAKTSNNNSTKTENVNKNTNVNNVKNNIKNAKDSEAANNIEEKLNIIEDLLGESEEKDKKLEDKKVEKSDNINIKNITTKKRIVTKNVPKTIGNIADIKATLVVSIYLSLVSAIFVIPLSLIV